MRKTAQALTLLLAMGGLSLFTADAGAEVDHWKVVFVSGESQVRPSLDAGWQGLQAPAFISKGACIRTGQDGTVDIVLDRGWENVVSIRENAMVDFVEHSPQELRLRQGALFILLESEHIAMAASTPYLSLQMTQGAAALTSDARGSVIQVFGDSVRVAPAKSASLRPVYQSVNEGMAMHFPDEEVSRMAFGDYGAWQTWFKKNYERKDKYLLKKNR